jgi:hypothetical protein
MTGRKNGARQRSANASYNRRRHARPNGGEHDQGATNTGAAANAADLTPPQTTAMLTLGDCWRATMALFRKKTGFCLRPILPAGGSSFGVFREQRNGIRNEGRGANPTSLLQLPQFVKRSKQRSLKAPLVTRELGECVAFLSHRHRASKKDLVPMPFKFSTLIYACVQLCGGPPPDPGSRVSAKRSGPHLRAWQP